MKQHRTFQSPIVTEKESIFKSRPLHLYKSNDREEKCYAAKLRMSTQNSVITMSNKRLERKVVRGLG